MVELFTIGHSTHTIERFLELLKMHGITAVCDVRSHPYSRYNPQFNREPFQEALKRHGIAYVFLGKELGPRSENTGCYRDGKIQYHLLSRTAIFQEGLGRLRKGLMRYRIALMCAEKDPLVCHRTILVCRHLRSEHIRIAHILEDGSTEENDDALRRLMRDLGIQERNLFESPEQVIERVYDVQGERIAYSEKDNGASGS